MSGDGGYDPSKDFAVGGSSSSTTAPPADPYADLTERVKRERKKIAEGSVRAAGDIGQQSAGPAPNPLAALSIVPAAIAAATTPDSYLVGQRGDASSTKRLGDISLIEQLFGENQLSLADPLKALFTSTQQQKDYLAGRESGGTNFLMKGLETTGLIADLAVDPANWIGGAGLADDAFKGVEAGAKLSETARILGQRAAVDGADSFASKGLAVVEKYHSVVDDLDNQLAQGLIDDATAAAEKQAAGQAFRKEYGALNGEAMLAGEHVLSQSRYIPGSLIHEAPTAAKARASVVLERLNGIAEDIAAHTGSVSADAFNSKLPTFGGRAGGDVVRDVYARGYAALERQAKEAIGVTGRLWRGNPADILSGRAFNPFGHTASTTLELGERAARETPFSIIRRAGVGEFDGTVLEHAGQALQPGFGRSGQLWKAALENTVDNPDVKKKALDRFERVMGTSIDKASAAELASYPLTVLNEARLDGIIRAGGKELATQATRAQREVSVTLARESEASPGAWTVAGLAGDVEPTPVWTQLKQAAFESLDGASGGKGQVKVELAQALHDAMKRADVPSDIMAMARDEAPSSVTMRVARLVVNDPEFGADIARIASTYGKRMTEKGLDEGDLVRATLNALTTTVSISNETEGVFSWIGALTREASAKELFSPRGAEAVGKEAKLLNYMEQMGLAVVQRNPEVELSTAELHDLINETADNIIGRIGDHAQTLGDLLEAKKDLLSGLRARGVTEDRIVSIEKELVNNEIDAWGLRQELTKALEDADVARGMATDAVEAAKQAKQLVQDVESAARKLENVQLSILRYRDLEAEAQRELAKLESAAKAIEMGSVSTQDLRTRLHQLLDPDATFDFPEAPPRDAYAGGRSHGAKLLAIAFNDDPAGVGKRAGTMWQRFNRFLGFARDVFGDAIELDQLGEHAAITKGLTRGFEQTEGAINNATIARFFEEHAHPRMQQFADEHGGWLKIIQDGDPEVLDEVMRLGKSVQATQTTIRKRLVAQGVALEDLPPALSAMGVAHDEIAHFTMTTLADAVDAIRPLLDDVIHYMETGQGGDRLERIFAGEYGLETLNAFKNGDLSFLDTLFNNVAKSLDIGIGVSGGFGDYSKFQMLRDVVNGDPALRSSFNSLLKTLDAIDGSSVYLRELADLGEAHTVAWENLQSILMNTPSIKALEAKRGPLVDKLVASDLPALGRDLLLTEEEAATARSLVADLAKHVRSTRARLTSMEGRHQLLTEAHAEAMKKLTIQESVIDHLNQLIDQRSVADIANMLNLQTEIDVMYETPMMATVLAGSADFQTVKAGFFDFATDPKNAFYTDASGNLVRRSDERIMEMWMKRLDGAATWVEKMRDRAVNGYWTRGSNPRFVEPITRYDATAKAGAEWLAEQGERGFSTAWRGAALADEGAAPAFIAIATHQRAVAGSSAAAAYDMVVSMLKAQYVGSLSFSPRNLTGGVIENIRQGVNLATSKRIWAADSVARSLEGFASFAVTMEHGPERDRIIALIEKLQAKAEKHFGEDLFGAVVEARQAGVTESVLFKEIAGQSVEGTKLGFRASVAQAWQTGRLSVEARFGDTPGLGTLGSVTSAVAEVPTHPAQWFEHHLAGGVERLARIRTWNLSKMVDPADWADLKLLEEGAEDFIAKPGVEALLRVDLFAQRRLSGDTVERAFDKVMESHFDYSDLSQADNVLRRIFPFWIWRSRSVAHYGEMMLHRPAMARTTFGLWNEQRRGNDPRTPRAYQEAGAGLDPNSHIGLQVPDPSSDFVNLINSIGNDGPLGPIGDMVGNDSLSALEVPMALNSGRDAQGVPIDTPASIQGPLDSIASSSSAGRSFVEQFAHIDKGKWYWNSPNAAYAIGEALPLLGNVSKITTPLSDGDSIMESVFGAAARVFGTPVRAVPAAEQERARRNAMIEARMSRKGGR